MVVSLATPRECSAVAGLSAKPRLLLCGHTYGVRVNRAKAIALSEWFEVLVCAPDFEGVVVFGRDGALQDTDEVPVGYQYRRLRRWPRNTGFLRSLLLGFTKEFRAWSPEYVLCEAEPWSLLRWQTWWLGRCQKRPPVFIEFTWENLPRTGFKGMVLRFIYRMAARTTQGVIAGNRGAEGLVQAAGLAPLQILRTGQLGADPAEHPPLTPEQKEAWRQAHGFNRKARVIGFCGRLLEQKGVLDLWDAVRRLRVNNPDIELALLGSGELETALRVRFGSETWCRILPPVPHEDVPAEIGCFDLMVLPSKPQMDPAKGDIWEEQFGHVLLEAMLCGVPVLGSSCGAIPEVLDNPQVIFPAGDVAALTALLERWLGDNRGLTQLAAEQQSHTAAVWSHEALAQRYARFMFSLNHVGASPLP
jgi:L-malate glycosyltransferase